MYVWEIIYPLLHVGVHELPLARLAVHGVANPFVGAADASHGLALHTAVLVVSVPAAHVLVPDAVYPLLHVGVHELPLARLAVHGVASPNVGAADASHALALHTTLSESMPAAQVLVPDNVYPLLHVGMHDIPPSTVEVHVPMPPFVGATTFTHGFTRHVTVPC
jgi:hypothetical protein